MAEIKDYLPKACPEGDSLILDGEVGDFHCIFNMIRGTSVKNYRRFSVLRGDTNSTLGGDTNSVRGISPYVGFYFTCEGLKTRSQKQTCSCDILISKTIQD